MPPIWCGGEDVDFPTGSASVLTTAGYFRAGYGRCGLQPSASAVISKSLAFSGGAVTSCWISIRAFLSPSQPTAMKLFGLAKSGTNAMLFVKSSAASASRASLATFDGTTTTELAAEAGNSFNLNALNRIDVQLVNYGATATVNVYVNGVEVISYSGDVTVLSNTNLDQVVLGGSSSNYQPVISEVIVADEDTRSWPGLATLALTGAGTTDQWTGVYSTINGTTISDATPNYVNVNDQEQQFNVTDLPTGSFVIKAVKIAARMAKSATPTPTKVGLGYKNGANISVGAGVALTTAYATYERFDTVDPTTGVAWASGDINGLQLEAKSLA